MNHVIISFTHNLYSLEDINLSYKSFSFRNMMFGKQSPKQKKIKLMRFNISD